MLPLNRRNLLKTIIGAFSIGTSAIGIDSLLRFNSKESEGLALIYKQWLGITRVEPDNYLAKLQVNSRPKTNESLENIIRDDFTHNKTIEIDGFILSKFEAAILASGGKWLMMQGHT